jgi:cell division protein FtsW
LFFLPEAHNDFILPVIAEELGVFSVILIASLFLHMTLTGLAVSSLQREDYKKHLANGLSLMLFIQAFLNMGVVMGLLPTKGLPLPFLSSGSTSILTFFIVIGLLIKISSEDLQRNDPYEAK